MKLIFFSGSSKHANIVETKELIFFHELMDISYVLSNEQKIRFSTGKILFFLQNSTVRNEFYIVNPLNQNQSSKN